jgi:V8-like Glu-specific endopeptidase
VHGKAFGKDDSLRGLGVTVAGYPGDKGSQELWSSSGTLRDFEDGSRVIIYDAHAIKGMSGSPVYILNKETNYQAMVCAVHVTHTSDVPNTGVAKACRLTTGKLLMVNKWLKEK